MGLKQSGLPAKIRGSKVTKNTKDTSVGLLNLSSQKKKGKVIPIEFHDHYPDHNPDSAIAHITNVLVELGTFDRAQAKRIAAQMK